MQLLILQNMQMKKIFFMCWQRQWQDPVGLNLLCMEDLVWTEDDMDHFLHTVATFETHKRLWKERRELRLEPSHREHGKQMPRMIPPSYVRLFQISCSGG